MSVSGKNADNPMQVTSTAQSGDNHVLCGNHVESTKSNTYKLHLRKGNSARNSVNITLLDQKKKKKTKGKNDMSCGRPIVGTRLQNQTSS